jgi:hypothetical protein
MVRLHLSPDLIRALESVRIAASAKTNAALLAEQS